MYTLTVASINSKLICYHVLNLNVSLSIATSSDMINFSSTSLFADIIRLLRLILNKYSLLSTFASLSSFFCKSSSTYQNIFSFCLRNINANLPSPSTLNIDMKLPSLQTLFCLYSIQVAIAPLDVLRSASCTMPFENLSSKSLISRHLLGIFSIILTSSLMSHRLSNVSVSKL